MGITLDIAARCDGLIGAGYACQLCGREPAVGHVTVMGGRYDGRIAAVLGASCLGDGHDEAGRAANAVLRKHYAEGTFDPVTGGPGPNGEPEMEHGDHPRRWSVGPT